MLTTRTGIAYDRTWRPAPRALLIHAGVADRRMWDPQWDALAPLVGLARLDLRGFGDSASAPDGPFSHARDVLDTMDEIGAERVHLVGSSFGAGVAVETALLAPDRVASLVLCPPGGSLLAALTDDLRAFLAAEDTALASGDLDAAVEANVRAWAVGKGRTIDEVDPAVVAGVRRMQRRAFQLAERLGDLDELELQPAALERLTHIAVPALVVVGAHDLDTTHDAVARVAAGIPDAGVVTWDDVAHLPSLEQPARFTALLRSWLAEQEPTAGQGP